MNSPTNINLYLIYLFLLLISFPLYGQTNLQFTGPIQIGDYQGIAKYTYQIEDEDTIFNGNFSAQSFNLNVLSSKEKDFFSIDGLFNAGFPDNTWSVRFGTFTAEEGAAFENYHFKVKVSGKQHTAIVNFDRGKPAGEWIHTIRNIQHSKVENTSYVSSSQFEDGIARGYLRIKNDSLTLLGRFLRNGLAHDIWELDFYKELGRMETWVFSEGFLEKIIIQKDENTEEFIIYEDVNSQIITVNLDHRYLKILEVQDLFNVKLYENKGGKMAGLIKKNASHNHKVENIVTNIHNKNDQLAKPKYLVKVAHYPLDEKELEQLDFIIENLQNIDTTSKSLIENTGLNILKHSDEEVMYLLSALEEISEKYILPVRKVVNYGEKNLLSFLPREELRWSAENNQASVSEIRVDYQDSSGLKSRVFTGPNPDDFDDNESGMPYLLKLSEYAIGSIKAIEKKLAKKIKQYSIKKELENLEKELLKEEDRLIFLVDSMRDTQTHASIDEPLQNLKRTAIAALAQYATEESLLTKPNKALQLIECMKTLQSLAKSLARQPVRSNEIQELYTEEVWNPFTATIMNDQVKQRITEAYDQVLIPYLHQQIENKLKCENSEYYLNLLDELYDKMVALRNQDTSKFERKLKNEKDPLVVLELFNLAM